MARHDSMGDMKISKEKDAQKALKIRKEAGLTQAELAHRLGASSRTVARWESGATAMPDGTIRKIEYAITGKMGETTPDDLQYAPSVTLGLEIIDRLKRYDTMAAELKELKTENEAYKIRYGEL